MVFHHEHHPFELQKFLHDRMSKLYMFQASMAFIKSLIGVFVPVYLYTLNYSIAEILVYYLAISFVFLATIPLSVKIINKFGFKYTLLISIFVYFFHILSLNYLPNPIFYNIGWLTFGFYLSLFWPAFHSEIAVNGSSKHRGSQVGTLQSITIMFTVFAPLIGGFVLQYLGYFNLLIFASFFVVVGVIPLLLTRDIKLKHYEFKHSDYIKFIKNDKNKKAKIAFKSEGLETALTLQLWPLILFMLVSGSFLILGSILSFVSLVSVVIIILIKPYFDRKSKSKILILIAKFLSLNWFFRVIIIFFTSIFLYFIETFGKLLNSLYNLTFTSMFYNNAKKSNYMDYIIFREFNVHGAKIMFFLVLIPMFLFFGENKYTLGISILNGILIPIGLTYLSED